MWEYFKLTGDDSLLLAGGAEVVLECARFYYSYAYFKKDKNRYEILDVIGPRRISRASKQQRIHQHGGEGHI